MKQVEKKTSAIQLPSLKSVRQKELNGGIFYAKYELNPIKDQVMSALRTDSEDIDERKLARNIKKFSDNSQKHIEKEGMILLLFLYI